MCGFLAIVAGSIIPGLALASCIRRLPGKTSSLFVSWLAELCTMSASLAESCTNDFLRVASIRIELVTSEYFTTVADVFHTMVTKVLHEGGRLIVSNMAFTSSSIVVP